MNDSELKDTFRDEVLLAMDQAALICFPAAKKHSGARDEDLPEIFKFLDAHVELLKSRLGETF
jgi:hypothetical protein